MLYRQGGDVADYELGPLGKARSGVVVGAAGGGMRVVSITAGRGRAIVSAARFESVYLHKHQHFMFKPYFFV